MSFKAKVPASFKADVVLEFASEQDFYDWSRRVYALAFATSEVGTRRFYIVQGRIVEVKIRPIEPKPFQGSVEVSGDLDPETRRFLKNDKGRI